MPGWQTRNDKKSAKKNMALGKVARENDVNGNASGFESRTRHLSKKNREGLYHDYRKYNINETGAL